MREAVRIAREHAKRRKPVQVRAEALDQLDLSAAYHAWQGFAPLPEVSGPSGENDGLGADAQEAVQARAATLAAQSDLQSYRVEVAPDGTISIIVADPE